GTIEILPHNRSRLGRGANGPCSVCRRHVSPNETAYEGGGGGLGRPAYAHPICYRGWGVEALAKRKSQTSQPTTWGLHPPSTSRHMVIDSTCRLLRSNGRLLAASRALIACSQRLLNPWHGISGGGSDDILDAAESNLYQHVRTRLQHHTLPLAPKLVHARRAT